jgi:hypothetical protein
MTVAVCIDPIKQARGYLPFYIFSFLWTVSMAPSIHAWRSLYVSPNI